MSSSRELGGRYHRLETNLSNPSQEGEMKALSRATWILLYVCLATPLAAADFVVVAATGALEPAGLAPGQELSEGTRLRLEPWGRVLARETGKCGLTHVVAGVGEYVLELSQDCGAFDDPVEVVRRIQKGDVFAARLQEAGPGQAAELVSAIANEPCVFMARLSEEPDNRRLCPSGYALRGLRCSGSFCDDKDLLCCPYLGGAPDPEAKETPSRQISEEWPNVVQSKRFMNGLTCWGPYCDNVLPHEFKSPHLALDTKQCDWTVWDSERPGTWLDCQLGRFVAGLRCRADYCGDVGLRCCAARVE